MEEHQNQHQRRGGHVCQCLTNISRIRSSSPVTIFLGGDPANPRQKTGRQFVESVQSLAHGLSSLGINPGDIVAIGALNSDLYLEWILAIAYVGAIVSPLNYRWSLEDARSALEILKPVMLVVDDSCAIWYHDLQTYSMPSLRWHVCLGEAWSILNNIGNVLTTDALKNSLGTSHSLDYQWAPDGTILICFTSGTSGSPKGVSISHTALIVQSLAKIAIVGYSEDDVYLHTAPLCHIGGISSGMAMLMISACHVLVPKFESRSVVHAIQQYHVSSLITVPAMMADLISYIRRSHKSWRGGESLNKILNGGGQLSNELVGDAAEIFPKAKLISAYGMTETCSSLTFKTLVGTSSAPHRDGKKQEIREGICVGKPAPHVELVVLENGNGKILTRGPHVMLKYWNHHQQQQQGGGWLDTGDIGFLDSFGELWLVGRSNGRIKSGGENVYPEEVEAILSCHPGVSRVVVVGVPDARYSEMVVACVGIKETWKWVPEAAELLLLHLQEVSSESLYNYCIEKKLTRFKIPKKFIPWRRAFPVTSTGKLKRDQVRRQVIEELLHLDSSSRSSL